MQEEFEKRAEVSVADLGVMLRCRRLDLALTRTPDRSEATFFERDLITAR